MGGMGSERLSSWVSIDRIHGYVGGCGADAWRAAEGHPASASWQRGVSSWFEEGWLLGESSGVDRGGGDASLLTGAWSALAGRGAEG